VYLTRDEEEEEWAGYAFPTPGVGLVAILRRRHPLHGAAVMGVGHPA
jgi:hypothetical protein